MRSLLLIVKFLALLAVAVGTVIGYGFFRAWQTNELPQVTSLSWQDNTITLGRATVLRMEARTPWHRAITSAQPVSLPDPLIPAATEATLTRGPLSWTGHRHWSLTIPLVATATDPFDGEPLKLPLSPTRRTSPNSFATPLPPLTVTTPEDLPEAPLNPLDLLTVEAPPAPVQPDAVAPQTKRPILPIAAAILVLAAATVILTRFFLRPKPAIPAWELAHSSLDRLQNETSLHPERFFSKLTDILKQYTAGRFHENATAASSTELIASLRTLPDLADAHRTSLASLVRQADAIRFADAPSPKDAPARALDTVRTYVTDTTPTPENT